MLNGEINCLRGFPNCCVVQRQGGSSLPVCYLLQVAVSPIFVESESHFSQESVDLGLSILEDGDEFATELFDQRARLLCHDLRFWLII